MNQNGHVKPDPIVWPTVTIGGRSFTLRFTSLQKMLYQDRLLAGTLIPVQGGQRPTIRQTMELLSIYISTGVKTYTAEEVADLIEADNMDAAMLAAWEAMGKVKPRTMAAVEPSPAGTETPSSNTGTN